MVRIFLLWVFAVSLLTLLLYGIDKRCAQKKRWRIAENTLFLFGLAGGAVGGILGMQLFRHKTRHPSFWFVNLLGVTLHAAALVFLAVKGLW